MRLKARMIPACGTWRSGSTMAFFPEEQYVYIQGARGFLAGSAAHAAQGGLYPLTVAEKPIAGRPHPNSTTQFR